MIVPEYETIELRLDWSLICKVACIAMMLGVDFERAVEFAVRDRLQQRAA